MEHAEFLREIAHLEVPWEKGRICVPVFYYDSTTVSAHFLASIDRVREALPSSRLQLGDHPIADELRCWGLGRLLAYEYAPQHQIILTPVIESLAV